MESLKDAMKKVYQDLFKSDEYCRERCIKYVDSMDKYKLFKVINEYFNSPRSLDPEQAVCDEAFSEYLFKVSKATNQDTFTRVLKFVVLYRESMNNSFQERVMGEDKEYSEIRIAEDAPDNSNEFVTEFLDFEPNMYGFTKDELIDLTMNLAQWLYDANYSCSKLSIINNN
jgi:hypothetical protein